MSKRKLLNFKPIGGDHSPPERDYHEKLLDSIKVCRCYHRVLCRVHLSDRVLYQRLLVARQSWRAGVHRRGCGDRTGNGMAQRSYEGIKSWRKNTLSF